MAASVPLLCRCSIRASALASPTRPLNSAVRSFTRSEFQIAAVITSFVALVVGAVQSSVAISPLRPQRRRGYEGLSIAQFARAQNPELEVYRRTLPDGPQNQSPEGELVPDGVDIVVAVQLRGAV